MESLSLSVWILYPLRTAGEKQKEKDLEENTFKFEETFRQHCFYSWAHICRQVGCIFQNSESVLASEEICL